MTDDWILVPLYNCTDPMAQQQLELTAEYLDQVNTKLPRLKGLQEVPKGSIGIVAYMIGPYEDPNGGLVINMNVAWVMVMKFPDNFRGD